MNAANLPGELTILDVDQNGTTCTVKRCEINYCFQMLNPRCNELLDQLTLAEGSTYFPHLTLVSLTEGQHIYGPGDVIDQFYFPVTALLAIAKDMDDGLSIDVAVIGKEGAIGFRGLTRTSRYRVYVTSSGLAYQISLHLMLQLEKIYSNSRQQSDFNQTTSCLIRMHAMATQAILDSTVLETGCAHFHTTNERVARWLLSRYERNQQNAIKVTHQKIADSLGVRREAVTNALLKMRGLSCCRNQIEILNLDELETQACECYRAFSKIKGEQLRLPFMAFS